jgi:hypothetical protein
VELESADFGSRSNRESFGFVCGVSVWARAEDAAKCAVSSAARNVGIRSDREFIGNLFCRCRKISERRSQESRVGAWNKGEGRIVENKAIVWPGRAGVVWQVRNSNFLRRSLLFRSTCGSSTAFLEFAQGKFSRDDLTRESGFADHFEIVDDELLEWESGAVGAAQVAAPFTRCHNSASK